MTFLILKAAEAQTMKEQTQLIRPPGPSGQVLSVNVKLCFLAFSAVSPLQSELFFFFHKVMKRQAQ